MALKRIKGKRTAKMDRSSNKFAPQVVCSFEIGKASEVCVYYDFFSGRIWANIRKFIKSERHTGPTKDGVKFDPKYLPDVLNALREAEGRRDTMSDEVFFRFPKNKSVNLVVHASSFKGTVGIDIRERYRTAEGSEGWGRGIRLGIEYLSDLINSLESMSRTRPDLKELGPQAPLMFEPEKAGKEDAGIEGVPENLKDFFRREAEDDDC